jgi:hypothetical protein
MCEILMIFQQIVNQSELPTDQSKSQKIACFHGNKRLDQSEHWILTF